MRVIVCVVVTNPMLAPGRFWFSESKSLRYWMVELPHFCVLSINTDMALEIPVHLQQQFPFVIHELQGIIDKETYQSFT
jgi:hypothetical protein